ncbi:MAG: hypothetical protein JW839_10260 [Candidatus Lokiarchaeota archaeon]|nr:hypothetical protein [Candidatus Lokiarchaeota archaeon]
MLMMRCSRDKNDCLHASLVDVIERQVEDGNPQEALLTLDRLIATGHTRKAAIEKMTSVLAEEIYEVLKDGHCYDAARYTGRLRAIE